MLGFCATAPLADAMAKHIATEMPLGQLVLVRFAIQAAILCPLILMTGQDLRMNRRLFGLLLIRSLLHIAGIWLMILSLRFLPLADAVAIAYVMPFVLLLLGWLLLKETVGLRRLLACAAGFAGTLFVMQPSFAAVGWVAALPMAVALVVSFFMLVTRQAARRMAPVPMQAVGGLLGTLLLLPPVLLARGRGWAELDPVSLPPATWGFLALLGLLGTLAHLLMTWSLRFAPAATVAPIQYVEIPFAVTYGWLIFGQLPNQPALLGICAVTAAGLYVIYRERRLVHPAIPKSPPPASTSAG